MLTKCRLLSKWLGTNKRMHWYISARMTTIHNNTPPMIATSLRPDPGDVVCFSSTWRARCLIDIRLSISADLCTQSAASEVWNLHHRQPVDRTCVLWLRRQKLCDVATGQLSKFTCSHFSLDGELDSLLLVWKNSLTATILHGAMDWKTQFEVLVNWLSVGNCAHQWYSSRELTDWVTTRIRFLLSVYFYSGEMKRFTKQCYF